MAKCCSLRDGIHDTFCDSIGEMDYMRCMACQQGVWSSSVSLGLCPTCLEKYGDALHAEWASVHGQAAMARMIERCKESPDGKRT